MIKIFLISLFLFCLPMVSATEVFLENGSKKSVPYSQKYIDKRTDSNGIAIINGTRIVNLNKKNNSKEKNNKIETAEKNNKIETSEKKNNTEKEIKSTNSNEKTSQNNNVEISQTKETIPNTVLINDDVLEKISKSGKCDIYKDKLFREASTVGYLDGKNNSSYEIENKLLKMKDTLDIIFDIKNLYINGILEPPLIGIEKGKKISEDGKVFTKKEVSYKVLKNARFKTPPTWEKYLLSKKKPTVPVYKVSFNYYTEEDCQPISEKELFSEYYANYIEGREETILLYSTRMLQLEKYIDGLFRYHTLFLKKIVEGPYISTTAIPISKTDNTMTISEEEYTIVEEMKFNTKVRDWKNFVVDSDKKRTKTILRKSYN